MGGLWMAGMAISNSHRVREVAGEVSAQRRETAGYQREIKDLQYQVQRFALLNQALWELLRERAKLTDADLEAKIREVDLRDGVEDGRMTQTGLKCPTCGRVSSSKHWKCLYCGQEFQKPVMG